MGALAIRKFETLARFADELERVLCEFAAYVDGKPATRQTYLNGARAFLSFLAKRGMAPDRAAVIAFRESLCASHKPTTAQTYMIAARRFLGWCVETGRIAANPADGVKCVRIVKTHKRDCLTAEQAAELLGSIDQSTLGGKRDYAMLALMITAGLRDCEVARARVCDLQTVCGQSALAVHGKGRDGADEHAHLAPQVERAIRSYLAERGGRSPDAPLFASLCGRCRNGALSTRSVSRIAKERMRAIGLDSDRLTAHSLRHTAATLNLRNGGTLQETQKLMRHSDINTTMIYAHNLEWAERKAESRVADAVMGGA